MTLFERSHCRRNALTGEWVLVSPHRAERPWRGQVDRVAVAAPFYDPDCYLCPGNARAGGDRNPDYASTFAFDNDFPALTPEESPGAMDDGLFAARPERGVCRVVCFTPDHALTLARMPVQAIAGVVDSWTEQWIELGAREEIRTVQIFENRGDMMGASNPHPHGQIWACESVPNEHAKEEASQRAYRNSHGRCLLCDYVERERREGVRVVFENAAFAVVAPFWAVWPFETLLVPKRHGSGLEELAPEERLGLADALKRLTTRYDNLFESPFPYTMGLHQRPVDGAPYPHVHWHAHFYPPLLRSATVRKFLVGFEMLAGPQRDITPESAAERLRGAGEVHYLDRQR